MVIRKKIDMTPEVARSFVDAMRDFFAEENPTKRDAIAAHQLSVLRDYQGPREKKLRLEDVKAMFAEMKDIVG